METNHPRPETPNSTTDTDATKRRRGVGRHHRVYRPRNGRGQFSTDFGVRLKFDGRRHWIPLNEVKCVAEKYAEEVAAFVSAGANRAEVIRWVRLKRGEHLPSPTGQLHFSGAVAYEIHRHPDIAKSGERSIKDVRTAIMEISGQYPVGVCYLKTFYRAIEAKYYYDAGLPMPTPRRGKRRELSEIMVPTDRKARKWLCIDSLSVDAVLRDFGATLLKAHEIAFDSTFSQVLGYPVRLISPEKTEYPQYKKAHDSSMRSLQSHCREIRALFTAHWAVIALERHGVNRTSKITEFLRFRSPIVPHKVPYVLSDAQVLCVMVRIHQLIRKGEGEVAMVLVLAVFFGLRHSEILHVCADWFLRDAGGNVLFVHHTQNFRPKHGKERRISVPQAHLIAWILASRPHGPLVADSHARRVSAGRAAVAELRQLGITALKPLHALRGLYAMWARAYFGDRITPFQMGHRSINTTIKYYAPEPLPESLLSYFDVPLPCLPWANPSLPLTASRPE